MVTLPLQEKVSIVAVLSDSANFDALLALDTVLSPIAQNLDYVLIANGLDEPTSRELIKRIHELPDTTIHFLPETVDDDFARLIAIDNAVGDWLLCIDDLNQSWDVLPQLFAALEPGIDHVTVRTQRSIGKQSWLYRLLSNAYMRAYNKVTGLTIDREGRGCKLYSRAAAQYILHNRRAEMLLHSLNLGNFFPGKIINDNRVAPPENARSTREGLIKGWRILMRSTTLPLRIVTSAAIASCIFNASYAILVVVIHSINSSVAPGWTTLSLQVSLMFFVISLLLALIGEYLVQIDRSVNHRLRYTIMREVRNMHSRLDGKRNVWRTDATQEPLTKITGT
ncbi:MAG: hypothetical protein EB059_02395 [Alphaproteobacteria bacterium]|nr:hypothetical protein [Alphaproteobacteria bacterium]